MKLFLTSWTVYLGLKDIGKEKDMWTMEQVKDRQIVVEINKKEGGGHLRMKQKKFPLRIK